MVGVGYRNVLLENMKPNSATVELADLFPKSTFYRRRTITNRSWSPDVPKSLYDE